MGMMYSGLGTDQYAESIYGMACSLAKEFNLAVPKILVIAKWEGVVTTCCDKEATSSDLEDLLVSGDECLVERGLLRPLAKKN